MTHADKLRRIDQLMSSPDVIELDALAAEVEAFEKSAFPIEPPTLAASMKFRRDQMGETQKEISGRAGMSLAVWRRLEAGHVSPTMHEARRLYAVGIPASVLLAAAPLTPSPQT